jgi:hypothetical protein
MTGHDNGSGGPLRPSDYPTAAPLSDAALAAGLGELEALLGAPRGGELSADPLALDLPEIPGGAHRNAIHQGGLELVAGYDDQVEVFDPDARFLMVFKVHEDGTVLHIGSSALQQRAPVHLPLRVEQDRATRLVAISAMEALDRDLWHYWLEDFCNSGRTIEHALELAAGRVHFQELEYLPRASPPLLQRTEQPLEARTDEVYALLLEAAREGRDGRFRAATGFYRRALALATELGDVQGRVTARRGMALALRNRGYADQAERVLSQLLVSEVLDADNAAKFSRSAAGQALAEGDLQRTEQWLTCCEQLSREQGAPPGDWLHLLQARLAAARGQHSRALEVLGAVSEGELPPNARRALRCLKVELLADRGDLEPAQALLSAVLSEAAATPEQLLREQLARAAVEHRAHTPGRWGRVVERLEVGLRLSAAGADTAELNSLLMRLVDRAYRDGAEAEAWRLLRLGLLGERHREVAPGALFAAVSMTPDTIAFCDPGRPEALRVLTISRRDFVQTSRAACQELRADGYGPAITTITGWLFPHGHTPPFEYIGSDGLLDGLPMSAFIDRVEVQWSFKEAHLLREAPARSATAPTSARSISLADSRGDLPHARLELPSADVKLHGEGATLEGLLRALELPVGLLHIAVHTRWEAEMPGLLLADAVLSAERLCELTIRGNPLVLLSGCTTAPVLASRGVRLSLADALKEAGASWVIATRWPVRDDEMRAFVEALERRWPFADPHRAVAEVCASLKGRFPPRLWASILVL